jgi:hypothetical protein
MLGEAMKGGNREDKCEGDDQKPEGDHLHSLPEMRKSFESRLEGSAAFEADQDLDDQDDHPALVQADFDPVL